MTLSRLTIKNIVLIESLSINFASGLSTLTGETGAGKSILLDSLGLTLGARADSGLVRHGTEKASVTAEFDLPPSHPIFAQLKDNDIDADDGEPIIIKRTLTSDGRSRASINDQGVSAKMLQQCAQHLAEIHGQFDTHGLLNPATHMALLDSYAQIDRLALSAAWRSYKAAKRAQDDLEARIEKAKADEEYLRASIETLDTLAPLEGEEESLATKKEQLMHRERVLEALNAAYAALNAENDPLNQAAGTLSRIADKLPDTASTDIIDALDRAINEVNEVRAQLETLSMDLSESEESLETVDERLYQLRKEARKHDCTVDELPKIREDLAQQLSDIEHGQDTLASAIMASQKAYDSYKTTAKDVSAKRKNAAQDLDEKIALELEPLKLGKAKFISHITQLPEESWGENGCESLEFLISTNTGQQPAAMHKAASGGELSRFMLALKVVMAAREEFSKTMIFDEVDAGIGGSTADAVGQRLSQLARRNQVLVVTHAPQVAAKATHHYTVQKTVQDDLTHTSINLLETMDKRYNEIARMLSGESITPEAKAAAKQLIERG